MPNLQPLCLALGSVHVVLNSDSTSFASALIAATSEISFSDLGKNHVMGI